MSEVKENHVEQIENNSNALPKSVYKGVSYFKITDKWVAKVSLNADENGKRKLKHVGYFKTDLEAAIARDNYIVEHSLNVKRDKEGEFNLNEFRVEHF